MEMQEIMVCRILMFRSPFGTLSTAGMPSEVGAQNSDRVQSRDLGSDPEVGPKLGLP